jgi:hypothetical protein
MITPFIYETLFIPSPEHCFTAAGYNLIKNGAKNAQGTVVRSNALRPTVLIVVIVVSVISIVAVVV